MTDNNQIILFHTEELKFERINTEEEGSEGKIIISGNAQPLNEDSRNGVRYRPESVKKAYKSLEGVAFLNNHDATQSLGHVAEVGINDTHITYKVDVDPEEKEYIRKVERGDKKHVSVGCMVENIEFNEDEQIYICDVKEYVELSAVAVPGFANTSASKEGAIYLANAMGDKAVLEKLEEAAKKTEADDDSCDKTIGKKGVVDANGGTGTLGKTGEESSEKDDDDKDDEEADDSDDKDKDKDDDDSEEEKDDDEDEEESDDKDKDDSEEADDTDDDKDKDDDEDDDKEESKKNFKKEDYTAEELAAIESGDLEDAEDPNKKEGTSQDEQDGEEELTIEEKVDKVLSQQEELFSKFDEYNNRLSIVEANVDAINDGEEDAEGETPEDEKKEETLDVDKSEEFKDKHTETRTKENLAAKEKALFGEETKKVNDEAKKVVDMKEVRMKNIGY